MFAKIIGWLSILWGILWILKPEFLRGWLTRKTGRYLFWAAMGILFFPMVHFGKRAGAAGVLVILAAIWIGMKALRTTLREAFGRIPLAAYRAGGVLSLASGCALLFRSSH